MSRPIPLSAARILLLAGGDSAEREISLKSGYGVATALQALRLNVELLDPALTDLHRFRWQPNDIAFVALHGGSGENGEIQAILEAAGVPFTGSGPAASQLAFSKSAAKLRFLQSGVPTPPFVLIHQSDSEARLREQAQRIGYPLVIKPDQQGSSIGVTIVHSPETLTTATKECFRYGPFGIIEQAIPGTEWTLGVLDDECLPLIRIETDNIFFDFSAKYQDETTRYVLDFDEPSTITDAIVRAGHAACRAVGTAGVARVDLRLDPHGQPFVLEVNTVPGFTDHSLVPKAAARIGLSFPELCQRMLESALEHAPAAPVQHFRPAPPAWPARQAG